MIAEIFTSFLGKNARAVHRVLNAECNQWAYNRQLIYSSCIPEIFQIELTNRCPMTCIMCPRTENMTRHQGFMDVVLFERIAKEISNYTSRIFLHHFGDSLLHPRLADCLSIASRYNIRAYLSTNPILLTEERIKTLVDGRLHELVISLDGVSSAVNIAVRGNAARNIEQAERNILNLIDYRQSRATRVPRIIMQFVKSRMNEHETEAWLMKWRSVEGIDQVKIKRYINWNGGDERINALNPETNGQDCQPIVVCDKPWTSVVVMWDGRVVPCCFDYNGQYIIGDLRKQSLKQIFTGEPMRRLRQAHRDGALSAIQLCSKCKDKEGYQVRKWYYPLSRWILKRMPLNDESRI